HRANVNALHAVDAIAFTSRGAVFLFVELGAAGLFFAPDEIIGDIDRFIVEQNALKPSVRTGDNANLLAEPHEYEIENAGKNQEREKFAQMQHRAVLDQVEQLIAPDDVGQKYIGNQKGYHKENRPFQQT